MNNNTMVLTRENANVYVPNTGKDEVVKLAFFNPESVTYFKDHFWGEGSIQEMKAGHMTIIIPDRNNPEQFDIYGADAKIFLSEHKKVGENQYVKAVPVLAIELTEETEVLTKVNGRLEASQTAPAGYFLVQQPKGEQMAISPDQFHMLYKKA